MVSPDELYGAAVTALAAKRLLPRDLAVFMAVLAKVNWRSGRANVTQRALAEQMGIPETHCGTSIRRLRKELLLARVFDRESGHNYFLINPRLAWVGSAQRRGHLFQQFDEAIKIPKLPE